MEGLRARGHDAVLLDDCDPKAMTAEYRVALRPTLPTPVPPEDSKAYARKTRKFLEDFERLPLSQPFSLDRPEEMEPFDAMVVGSDEVWNLRHPWYAGRSDAYPGIGIASRFSTLVRWEPGLFAVSQTAASFNGWPRAIFPRDHPLVVGIGVSFAT